MDVVRAKGLEVAFERAGTGPPLVLVHGAAEDHRIWRPQLSGLAAELTVVPGTSRGPGARPTCPRVSPSPTTQSVWRR